MCKYRIFYRKSLKCGAKCVHTVYVFKILFSLFTRIDTLHTHMHVQTPALLTCSLSFDPLKSVNHHAPINIITKIYLADASSKYVFHHSYYDMLWMFLLVSCSSLKCLHITLYNLNELFGTFAYTRILQKNTNEESAISIVVAVEGHRMSSFCVIWTKFTRK